jgi:hypothetical protein
LEAIFFSSLPPPTNGTEMDDGILELADGSFYPGINFGAEGKSIAGECVFQTGEYPFHNVCMYSLKEPFL